MALQPGRFVSSRRRASAREGPVVLAPSLAAPVLLGVGALLARAVQPPGSYHPVAQTVSTLASRGATDR